MPTCKVLWTYASCFSAVKFPPTFLALAQAGNADSPFYSQLTPQNKSSLHSPLQTNLFYATNKSLVPRLDLPGQHIPKLLPVFNAKYKSCSANPGHVFLPL